MESLKKIQKIHLKFSLTFLNSYNKPQNCFSVTYANNIHINVPMIRLSMMLFENRKVVNQYFVFKTYFNSLNTQYIYTFNMF